MKIVKNITSPIFKDKKEISDQQAEEAFKTILRWIGENPEREGLIETPKRVIKAFKEYFKGYKQEITPEMLKTFGDVNGYDDMVLQKNISIQSHCEHHMAPIIGVAHVAYLPNKRVVGISKLARITRIYMKRMQIQEKLTAQIANCIQDVLKPRGVAVVIEAQHQCMTTRGIGTPGISMVTSQLLGKFRTDSSTRREFYSMINQGSILKKN